MTTWVAGVDGCPGGWVAVTLALDGAAEPLLTVHPTFGGVLDSQPGAAIVAVDMPIGLPDQVGPGGRGPETLLRPLLGARQSSVFSVPSRAAVEALDYRDACAAALRTSVPPRAVSKQCYFLFPKSRDVDALLRADPGLRDRVRETHPEGAFMRLNGGAPLSQPKKVKSSPYGPGLEERRALLERAGFAPAFLEARPPRGAAFDDVLDACACAVSALRIARGEAQSFPSPPGRDAHGVPVAIWI
jgi:predicted RNase H-like nuclease